MIKNLSLGDKLVVSALLRVMELQVNSYRT